MRITIALTLLSTLVAATPLYKPFNLPTLTTHQPNGNAGSQVNYYRIAFDIVSNNSGSRASAYCAKFWGDNTWTQSADYSLYVPTGVDLPCYIDQSLEEKSDVFSFLLFPYFSIGNFSLQIQQELPSGKNLTGKAHITNNTGRFTCDINSKEVKYQQHAQGDCSLPDDDKGPLKIAASLFK